MVVDAAWVVEAAFASAEAVGGSVAGASLGLTQRRSLATQRDRRAFSLDNQSGYDSADLRRFIEKGLRATGTPSRGLRVVVVSAPERSRGCATVSGKEMVIAIASPSRYSLRRLARLIEHEAAHLRGMDHGDMPRDLLYSLGAVPRWARDGVVRYRQRAPDQLLVLKRGSLATQRDHAQASRKVTLGRTGR